MLTGLLLNTLYSAALLLLSPVIAYRMLRHGRYRRGLREKLFGLSKKYAIVLTENQPCVWLHAVSVGEVNLSAGLIKRLQSEHPNLKILLSTSTDTGYDLALKLFGADRVFFCPLDFSWAVYRTIQNLRPTMLVLVELELWPHLVRIASAHNIPIMVINARLSPRSAAGYQRFGFITRSIFARLTFVGCQTESSADRFIQCGTPHERVNVTGSIKFDDAPSSRETFEVQSRVQWAGVDPWNRVWVVGSTQPGEEAMALRIYKRLLKTNSELRLVLVPRHVERFDAVASEITHAGFVPHRRSCDGSLHSTLWMTDRVILVDTIGELRHWWGVSHIATVGGSFGTRGGQNMLEPAGYGSAVSFGPDTRNFKEIANQLVDEGGAIRVSGEAELEQFVYRCLIDLPGADALGRTAQRVIKEHQGARDRTIAALRARLPKQRSQREAA